ncbi:hypothetical protein EK21DRAFT_66221 [Setomelanomma holmii]|uniref:Uncharacterized protein n=1 Tax=Setomelanomma holmii TaxID=210430 RepID=A0A9P4HAR1_9PLEO|nr:hypothetical protein EK21DRAFT_66221 [Setomelanomma holmii]
MDQHLEALSSSSTTQPNVAPKRIAERQKGRKFFQQLQPTFAIDLPSTTITLEFLDQNDPAKDTIVRKKAREWVNRNRSNGVQSGLEQSRPKANVKALKVKDEEVVDTRVQIWQDSKVVEILDPLQGVGKGTFDPFNLLPHIGRKYDHIIEYFLTTCPEEIPCSDDKYADRSLVSFSRENTILGNMAETEVTFVLWLYATISIRDGIFGCVDTEEVRWFYNRGLQILQETLKKESEAGQYSEQLLKSLACITATASFSGMFWAAELHRDAMIRVLTMRGDGDIIKGMQGTSPWTVKAVQWCEIMPAVQLVESPRIPYFQPFKPAPVPEQVVREAERLTANTLSNLPPLSEPIQYITHLLHQLGVTYHRKHGGKIDMYIIQPLYDAESTILQVLESQKETTTLTDVEILLVNTYQLFFWTGARSLPPQTRLCDLLLSRIMKALLPLLLEKVSDDTENTTVSARGYVPRTLHHPRSTNNVIAWSLALGTIVSSVLNRPEHAWLKGHFRLHTKAMKLDEDETEYRKMLEMFPATQGFAWIDLRMLFPMLRAWKEGDEGQT